MDPFLATMMQQMQGTQAMQPQFQGADPGGGGGGMSDLQAILGGIQPPQPAKPQFSGGVSGAGMPFLQAMPNLISPALQGSAQRVAGAGQMPSLGQLIAGG